MTRTIPALSAAIVAGLLASAGRAAAAPRDGASLLYRTPAFASAGWDLRDERNRPVRDPALERELEASAREAVFAEAFGRAAPTVRSSLELGASALGRAFWSLTGKAASSVAAAWLCPESRRPEAAPPGPAVGEPPLISPSSLLSPSTDRSAVSFQPLVLRC